MIEIYTSGHCPYCVRAKMLLEQKQAAYQEYKLEQDPELRSQMLERSNGGYTVPQIFINDHHVGGCDDLYALEYAGKLNALLAQVTEDNN